jgi:hypothetical protein
MHKTAHPWQNSLKNPSKPCYGKQNRKYFKYAIGEIVLSRIIGILIAWIIGTNTKETKPQEVYVLKELSNLNEDAFILNDIISQEKKPNCLFTQMWTIYRRGKRQQKKL